MTKLINTNISEGRGPSVEMIISHIVIIECLLLRIDNCHGWERHFHQQLEIWDMMRMKYNNRISAINTIWSQSEHVKGTNMR